MNERLRKFLPFIILGLVVVMFLAFAQGGERSNVGRDLSYSGFIERVEAGEVRSVTMKGGDITGTLSGNTLTLVEEFDYSDGATETRTWEIDVLGDGMYRGTANDVPGIAEGQAVAVRHRKVGDSFEALYREIVIVARMTMLSKTGGGQEQ